MKTLKRINDLLEGKIQSIFVIQKYDITYIMAVMPNRDKNKEGRIGFISIGRYTTKIHCSELSGYSHAQSIETLTRAFRNGDEVINFATQKEFQEWRNDETEINDLLPEPYWVYWANEYIPDALVDNVKLINNENKYTLTFDANRDLAEYELKSLLKYIANEKL